MTTRNRRRPATGRPGTENRTTTGPTRTSPAPARRAAPSAGLRRLSAALMLVALTAAVYAPVRHHGFVSFDDTVYVTDNEHVTEGLTVSGMVWALTDVSSQTANWHPLTWMSHMADVELFGVQAGPHHVVSAILHALNALLLLLLLEWLTGHLWRSALVAALFTVHPLHVESVAWIAERKDVLSTLFWLLTTLAYVAYVRRPGRALYAAVLAFFALGLTAKPMLVTLPFTLLLLDWWPLCRIPEVGPGTPSDRATRWRRFLPLVVEKWPLFALSVLSSLVTVVAQRHGGAVVTLETIALPTRAANALVSYAAYLWQMVWPAKLSVFYPHPGAVDVPATAAALVLLAGVTTLAVRQSRTRRHIIVGWLWYLGTLAPVIGLIQVGLQARADRYTYIPLIGVFVLIVWEVADRVGTRRVPRLAAGLAACAIIAVLAVTARARVAAWVDDDTLWRHALSVDRDNYYAHYSLGRTLLQGGRRDEALPHLERALELAPWFAELHDTMGLARARTGDLDGAIAGHLEALRLKPGLRAARVNLGLAYEQRGDLDVAAEQYREAIRLEPRNATFRAALGHVLVRLGQVDAAVSELREALRLQPSSAAAHYGMGAVFVDRGQTDDALVELRAAIASDSEFAPAHGLLGSLLADLGRTEEALTHLGEAVRLEPESASDRAALGSALASTGRLDDAVVEYGEAVRLEPTNAEFRHSLGLCLARQGRMADAATRFTEALGLRPESDVYRVSLGMALAATGDTTRGIAELRQALKINPGNEQARMNLRMLEGLGR